MFRVSLFVLQDNFTMMGRNLHLVQIWTVRRRRRNCKVLRVECLVAVFVLKSLSECQKEEAG